MLFANIETTAYGGDETLFFIRIKGREQYFDRIYGRRPMARLFGHIERKWTISEYRNADFHIDLDKYSPADMTPQDYDVYYAVVHQDLAAVVARCRGLRNIPYAEAKDLVLRACKFFIEFFRSHGFRLVVIAGVDNYVLDLMTRVAGAFGVKVICLSEWFIEHYRRHTIFGELVPSREPSDDEVGRVLALVRSGEKNFWLRGMGRANRRGYALRLIARYWILYVLRYQIRYRLLGDRSYEYRFAHTWPTPLGGLWASRFFDPIDAAYIDANQDRLIVVPLHTFPEANVDYWMTDYRHADYYTSIFEAASFFRAEGLVLLVKEHPGFLYQRDPGFYKELKQFDNVRLIDPMTPEASLLERVPTVLVWHGTMGVEALLRGRKVIAFDSNHYSDGFVPGYRDYKTATTINEDQARLLMRRLLSAVTEL